MVNVHSDMDLLHLWQNGDDRAFEAIYKRYAVKLLAVAMQKTNDRDIAEELVQDTFMGFFNKKEQLKDLTSPMAYLYVILKNKIMDKYRHDVIHQRFEDYQAWHFNEADNSTMAFIETRELERMLNDEIEKLPTQCRTVFNLSRKEQLTNKEIASSLSISENTVEQHMRKALKVLRGSILPHIKIILFFITGL